jgi:hypothetical protein
VTVDDNIRVERYTGDRARLRWLFELAEDSPEIKSMAVRTADQRRGIGARILAVCEQVPTIILLFLDRPAVVPEIAEAAAGLVVEFGARDDAVVDVLLGAVRAQGRLPFDLPSSMRAVADSRSDVPRDTANPLFRFGDGIVS